MEKKLIKGISHIAFLARDMDKALNFYCNILGLEKAFEIVVPDKFPNTPDMPENPLAAMVGQSWIVYLKLPAGEFLELFYPLTSIGDLVSTGATFNKLGYSHLSMLVDDIYEAARILENKGIKLLREISMGLDYTYQFWISDPDGNLIEVMQYTDKSQQMIHGIKEQ